MDIKNKEKLNIILDLDCCLLHSHLEDLKVENYKEFKNYKKKLEKIGFSSILFKYKFDERKKDSYSLTFFRPHLKEFITYLFKNYNVSVWSNGYYTYVDKLCDIIFTKSQRKKLKIIFGSRFIDKKYVVYDIVNKKIVYEFTRETLKDLAYLFNNNPYSTIFNKNNAILIDDSDYHFDHNKHNVLNIKHWIFYEQDDTILLQIINYLKSSNVKTNKLPRLKTNERITKSTKKSHKKNK